MFSNFRTSLYLRTYAFYIKNLITTIFLKKIFIYLLCIQYSVYLYACKTEEGSRPHYRWLWASMLLVGIELKTFGGTGNALKHWAISPALITTIFKLVKVCVILYLDNDSFVFLPNYTLGYLQFCFKFYTLWHNQTEHSMYSRM